MWLRRRSGGINRLVKRLKFASSFDKLTMRSSLLKTVDLILSLSKDEPNSGFFSSLLRPGSTGRLRALWARRALLLFWG